jgi:hypothetical protein
MTLTPGVYDLPEADYFAATDALSCSGAKLLLPPSCPALFRYRQDHPVHKDVFDFGSAAHRMVLGAGPSIITVDAPDWKSKAARESRDAIRADGMIPLLVADAARVEGMANAIWQDPRARAALNPDWGKAEQSLFWTDEETGVPRRARLDYLPNPGPGRFIVADYKSAASAAPGAFAKAAANFGYHMQDPYYLDGVRALGLDDDPAFLFVVQEKEPPYLVNVIQLDEDARAAGRERNRRAIERFRDCTEAGRWPGYSEDIEQISLPPWALRDLEYA